MDANSDYLIIKRKAGPKDTHKYDVHIVERLINQGLFRNVCYMMAGLSNRYLLDENRHFLIDMYKECLSKWDY